MVRTAGIARPIMDCLLKNNGYWIVPVLAVLGCESQVKRRRRRDRSKFNSLCQRGGWLRRANGAGRALGTGAALRPVLAGIRAMNGTLSAKRCVQLAPCSAAEAPCTGLSASAWEWPASALGRGGEVSSPPQIVQLRIAAAISRGGQCRSNTV